MAVAEQLRHASGDHGRIHSRQAFEAALDPWPSGLCIGVSHEGETKATVAAMRAAREAGAATALITAAADRDAGEHADHIIATPLIDRSWCHTVGYLSPVLAGGLVAASQNDQGFDAQTPERVLRNGLGSRHQAEEVAGRLNGARQVVVVGSGADRIAARELALKIAEGVRLPTSGLDLETVLHGHFAGHDEHTALIAIVTDPRSRERRSARAEQVIQAAERIGIRTAAIAADTGWHEPTAGSIQVEDPTTILQSLLASGVALQLLTVAMAHAAGVNPDIIRREDPAYRGAAEVAESHFPW